MLNQKKQAEIDQAKAEFIEIIPPFWKKLYDGLIEEEFTKFQAMDLLKTYISTSCSI